MAALRALRPSRKRPRAASRAPDVSAAPPPPSPRHTTPLSPGPRPHRRSWGPRAVRAVVSAAAACAVVFAPPWSAPGALLPVAEAADVLVDENFAFNGQHSDFAQQFYVLSTDPEVMDAVAQVATISASDLPGDVRSELATVSLSWEGLPGLLQRAILWDYGYALSTAGRLTKVYTRCGRTMAEIFVPKKAVERVGCAVQACDYAGGAASSRPSNWSKWSNSSSSSSSSVPSEVESSGGSDAQDATDPSEPSGDVAYRSETCDVDALTRIALCAVDDTAVSAPSFAAVWGDGGSPDFIPFVTVRRHVWSPREASASTAADAPQSLLFALHTVADEVALHQCPPSPALVIPCAAYSSVDASRFCSPGRGDVLAAWLTKYAADHKEDKTWLLVPLCIVTFVSVGVVAVYRYKAALRDQNQQLVDQFMRENRHLFDNGSVEAFLVSRHSDESDSDESDSDGRRMDEAARRYVRFQRRRRWKRRNRRRGGSRSSVSSGRSSGSDADDGRSRGSDDSDGRSSDEDVDDGHVDDLESGRRQSTPRRRGPREGALNAAAFEYFDAAIGLSASAFDPLASSARVHPLRTPHADAAMTRLLRSSRRNELAIRSFRLFESHKKIRRLRVPLRELQPLRLLSSGATGEVWLALHGSKHVAIKQLVPAKRRVLREMEMFLAEIYLLAQLKHRCIVPLVAIAWNTLEHVVMVQEYMEGGDLKDYLATQRPSKPAAAPTTAPTTAKDSPPSLSASSSHRSVSMSTAAAVNSPIEPFSPENRAFTWSRQRLQMAQAVASALAYMHALTPKLLHRDVKSRNVLLNAHLEAKLSDFGISRRKFQLEDDAETNRNLSVAGTMAWTAPELLLGEAYTEKVDIYSFGVLLSEIDTCLLPYHDAESMAARLVQHPLRLMKKILHDGARPRLTADCPPKIAQLVAACVHRDPRMRPSAGEVLALLAAVPAERGLLSRKSSSFVS